MVKAEFRAKREQVLRAIDPGVLLVFSAPVAIRNNDVEHEYRQDSNFFYLTGFDEPESVLVLSSVGERTMTLFVRPSDPQREIWDGARAGVEGAISNFGADCAYPIQELEEKLPDLLRGAPRLFYRIGEHAPFDSKVLAALSGLRRKARLPVIWPTSIHDLESVVHAMRLRKDGAEVAKIRRAIAITGEAHAEAMRSTRPGMYEYEVEALFRRVFRARGSERPAYPPIIGSGPNATVLHHRRNDRRIQEGDLVLVDAGCEYEYYAADVTRTYPASGRFTPEQRRVYEIVLRAADAAIARVQVGATLDEVHQAALEPIVDGLIDLGWIQGPRQTALEETSYREFFMHRTSHWLGMDVHDVGRYFSDDGPQKLEPGMVFTIEPGIYVSANSRVPEAFRGIGVRIEDDVLVDDRGPVVLSEAIPRTVEEVEQACAR